MGRSKREQYFRDFDKEKIFETLDKISIKKEGDEVATYFGDRQVSRKRVSNRYEVFDFKPFVKSAIEKISELYNIKHYVLTLTGGRQEIQLRSDAIKVGNDLFYKTFFLLNSSDKTRALNLAYGMVNNDFTFITNTSSINKRHYTGITELVETNFDISDTVFDEQVEILRQLDKYSIKMSKMEDIITYRKKQKFSKDNNGTNTLTRNFRMFCKYLSKSQYVQQPDLINRLTTEGIDFQNKVNDFHVDAYGAFKVYLSMFQGRDSYEIKKESERVLRMTTQMLRKEKIKKLKSMKEVV